MEGWEVKSLITFKDHHLSTLVLFIGIVTKR